MMSVIDCDCSAPLTVVLAKILVYINAFVLITFFIVKAHSQELINS